MTGEKKFMTTRGEEKRKKENDEHMITKRNM
jgi:hypothetical protein